MSTFDLQASAGAGPVASPAEAVAASRPRIAWIESARGLNIAMVVLSHVASDMSYHVQSLGGDKAPGARWIELVDFRSFDFRMPFFFLLSGLFAERFTRRDSREFFWDRFSTLVYPYFLWSAIEISVLLVMGRFTSGRTTLYDLLAVPVHPYYQFWFIYVLFFVSVAYWALRRAGLSALGCAAAALAIYGLRDQLVVEAWPTTLSMFTCMLYYSAGAVIGLSTQRIRIERPAQLFLIAAGGIAAWAVLSRGDNDAARLAGSFFGIAGAIATASLVSRWPATDFLKPMGRRSLEIYLTHPIFIWIGRFTALKLLKVQDVRLCLLIMAASALVGPLVFAAACSRLNLKYAFRLPRREKAPSPPPSPTPAPAVA